MGAPLSRRSERRRREISAATQVASKEAEEAEVKDEKRIAEARAKVKDAEALLAEATEALTKLEA